MPTGFTPIYKIMKGGIDITDRFDDRTTQIEVILKGGDGDSDTCTITVDDRDWRISTVDVGAKLEVYLGYKEIGLAQQGIFEVETVDYVINPQQIEITGTSVGFEGAIKTPAIRSFEQKTLGEIIGQIAGDKGIEAFVSPELGQIKIPYMNQMSSPLHMLHELERRFGALAKIENQRLIFIPRDGGQSAGGIEMPVLVLRPPHLTRGFVRHTRRSVYDGVKVGYFDENHTKQYVRAQDPNASVETDGEGQGDYFLSKQLGRSKAEAERMAKSQMSALKRQQGEAHLWLSKGDPWIRDQMRVLLQQFRSEVNGSYVTDTVTHTFTKEPGLATQILAKPPGTGADYTSLDEGVFERLGRQLPNFDSVVPGEAPAVPTPIDPIRPDVEDDDKATPVEIILGDV